MNVYGWAMRHALVIVFAISFVLFLIGIGQAVLALNTGGTGTLIGGEQISASLASFLLFLSGTFSALSAAAIPFIGTADRLFGEPNSGLRPSRVDRALFWRQSHDAITHHPFIYSGGGTDRAPWAQCSPFGQDRIAVLQGPVPFHHDQAFRIGRIDAEPAVNAAPISTCMGASRTRPARSCRSTKAALAEQSTHIASETMIGPSSLAGLALIRSSLPALLHDAPFSAPAVQADR